MLAARAGSSSAYVLGEEVSLLLMRVRVSCTAGGVRSEGGVSLLAP